MEPRKMKALLRVALNALAQTEVNLVTFAHGEMNDAYVRSQGYLSCGFQDRSDTISHLRMAFYMRVDMLFPYIWA